MKPPEERRREPRYRTRFPCVIRTPSKDRVKALATNLSLSGIELSGTHKLVTTLYPNFKRPNRHEPIEVKVEMLVPTAQKTKKIAVQCLLIYVRRRRFNYYSIGCSFCGMNKKAEVTLNRYVRELSRNPSSDNVARSANNGSADNSGTNNSGANNKFAATFRAVLSHLH